VPGRVIWLASRGVRRLYQNPRGETAAERQAVHEDLLEAERDLAAARGEQYARVIDIDPLWDNGAPLPHLISNGSRAFVVCRASDPDPDWDGTCATMVSPSDAGPSPFVVIELRGCAEIRLGGPNDEALNGHPLYSKGLVHYRAHEVFNSAWIETAIRVNSAHPRHSDAPSATTC
jgi:hypothetical protein